jgi:hypothetical protein
MLQLCSNLKGSDIIILQIQPDYNDCLSKFNIPFKGEKMKEIHYIHVLKESQTLAFYTSRCV